MRNIIFDVRTVSSDIKNLFPMSIGMLCVRSIIPAWGPACIRGASVSERREQERGFPPPSSPVVGGRLAKQLSCAGCDFSAVEMFLA